MSQNAPGSPTIDAEPGAVASPVALSDRPSRDKPDILDRAGIRVRRLARGMTLEEACAAAGWADGNRSRWQRIEGGRQATVTLDTLCDLARALRCSPRALLSASIPI